MKNLPQIIGVGLLVTAGILGWMGEIGLGWIAFGITGIITAGCAIRNEVLPTQTVSQWIQDLTTNKVLDYSIGAVGIAFATWRYFVLCGQVDLSVLSGFELAMTMAYWPLVIGLLIHFFANKN